MVTNRRSNPVGEVGQENTVFPTCGAVSTWSKVAKARLFFVAFPLLFLVGCGADVYTVVSTSVTLSANPTSIASGSSAILTVVATGATQVAITGSDGSHFILSATGGSQSVTPAATTIYTATATTNGANATASATVTVIPNATPANVTLSAIPASITSGSSSVLSATATNATQVVITGSDGSRYTLPGAGGSQSVNPTATTTYTATATATGAGGNATASATVAVTPAAATVTLAANPASITSGSSSVLSATATNATQVVITGSDGSRYTLPGTGGSQSVNPTATTTYTATATGAGGSATASTTVTVTPAAATVTLAANPASITSGNSSTLTTSATNATQVVITGSDGSRYTLPGTGGSQSVNPTATTTYTATATGAGGNATASATVTVTPAAATVTLAANPNSIPVGNSSVLTATATNATQVVITGSDGSQYTLPAAGGNQSVTPLATTTYTATATGMGGNATASVVLTVTPLGASLQSITHVIFMLQENHSFDNYLGMLNPYRTANHFNVGDDGKTYAVDGIDDKLATISNQSDEGTSYPLFKFKSSCVDDETSSWLESYGDVSRYDFSLGRGINMDGFVHTAENFAKNCQANGRTGCAGSFTDFTGQRAMGYYDESFLNYYYYMASQFAVSDRWFSPLSSKSIPNRIATFTGGTTQGLAFDPGNDDHLSQLQIPTIFSELSSANVTWKIYYTVTQGACLSADDCSTSASAQYPATDFSYLGDSFKYLYENPGGGTCVAPTQASSVVGDTSNSFCIDPTHIAPLSTYYTDLTNGTLPSFAFIEAGYGVNDEHPGSGQSILPGQQQVATLVNALMQSSSWMHSVFFMSYDEGGGPYDHVPPVPGHSNDFTDAMLGSESISTVPDISSIAVNPDSYPPCVPGGTSATLHCDLVSSADPGAHSTDAAAMQGFGAQLGFRLPNMIVSPYTRRHYVSHVPMDHTAIIKFVENRFIGSAAHLTARDEAQPDLLNLFDFNAVPWATPPTPPTPVSPASLGYDPCTPTQFAP
jgi:phospholipase C